MQLHLVMISRKAPVWKMFIFVVSCGRVISTVLPIVQGIWAPLGRFGAARKVQMP